MLPLLLEKITNTADGIMNMSMILENKSNLKTTEVQAVVDFFENFF